MEKTSLETEIELYCVKKVNSTSIDVYGFWTKNKLKYPVFSALAQQHHAIPVTSAASECVWSVAELYMTKRRGNLS